MELEYEFLNRKFEGYRVSAVFFGGYKPFKSYTPETFDSIEKARVFAIKVINRNKDAYVKGFIEESYQGYYGHDLTVEKVEKVLGGNYGDKNRKATYWMVRERKDRNKIFQISPTTGKIVKTEPKKK